MQLALQAILVSPHFLFRVELDPEAKPGQQVRTLNEYELASRLSYFLWSSMPDDELFDLAARGKLREEPRPPGAADARRPKVQGAGRELRRAVAATAEPRPGRARQVAIPGLRPGPAPRDADRVGDVLRGRSCARTAACWNCSTPTTRSSMRGWPGTTVCKALRATSSAAYRSRRRPRGRSARGGVLTQAAMLTVTSNPRRTSPVKRGKWVLGEHSRHAAA